MYSSPASPPTRGNIPLSGDLRRCYLRRRRALKIAIPSWASCPCLVPPQLGGADARPPLAPRPSARAQCLRAGACRLPSRALCLGGPSRYSSPSTGIELTLDRGFAPVLGHPRASHRTPKLGSPRPRPGSGDQALESTRVGGVGSPGAILGRLTPHQSRHPTFLQRQVDALHQVL